MGGSRGGRVVGVWFSEWKFREYREGFRGDVRRGGIDLF